MQIDIYKVLHLEIPIAIQVGQLLYASDGEPIDFVFLDANAAGVKILGVAGKEEILGKKATEFFSNMDSEWLTSYGKAVKTQNVVRFEVNSPSMGGWFDILVIPLSEQDQLAVVYSDINESKEMVKRLRQGEAKYRTLFETSNDGFWWLDKDGYVTEINEGTARLLGYNRDEIIGKRWIDFVDVECLDKGYHELQERKSGRASRYEIKLNRKDGSSIWATVSGSPLMDEHHEYCGALAAFNDITEQTLAKERVLALVSELEEGNRNKIKFISRLSHELRNPLATLVGGIELLEFQVNNVKNQRTVKILKRQIEHLSRLVDDLLDITRVSKDKMAVHKGLINLNDIVRDAIEDMELQFEKKGISLYSTISDQPIVVNADPLRITQCIINVLVNALRYTPQEGTVRVSLAATEEHAIISIEDNGVGISPDALARVFDPFEQDSNLSCGFHNRGLGLGLSIVKIIMDAHGGDVGAESAGLGQGSLFTLQLPIHPKDKLGLDNRHSP